MGASDSAGSTEEVGAELSQAVEPGLAKSALIHANLARPPVERPCEQSLAVESAMTGLYKVSAQCVDGQSADSTAMSKPHDSFRYQTQTLALSCA